MLRGQLDDDEGSHSFAEKSETVRAQNSVADSGWYRTKTLFAAVFKNTSRVSKLDGRGTNDDESEVGEPNDSRQLLRWLGRFWYGVCVARVENVRGGSTCVV